MIVEPYHIPGEENPADLFTKSLVVVKVEKFRAMIGLMYRSVGIESCILTYN